MIKRGLFVLNMILLGIPCPIAGKWGGGCIGLKVFLWG